MGLDQVVDHVDDPIDGERRGRVRVQRGRPGTTSSREPSTTARTVSSTTFRNVRLSARHCGGSAPNPIGCDARCDRPSPAPRRRRPRADPRSGPRCGRSRRARSVAPVSSARMNCARELVVPLELELLAGIELRVRPAPTRRGSRRCAGGTRRSRCGTARPGRRGARNHGHVLGAVLARLGREVAEPLEQLDADAPTEALGVRLDDRRGAVGRGPRRSRGPGTRRRSTGG